MKTEVLLDIEDFSIAAPIQKVLETLPDTQLLEKGKGQNPNVIIAYDDPDSGNISDRIPKLVNGHAEARLFIVSKNKDPEHIIDVIKAGAAEYFVHPINEEKLLKCIKNIHQTHIKATEHQGSIFSFISSKGGQGATVLAVNTATAWASGNSGQVALCDLSLQSGDSAVFMDIVPDTTIGDLCSNFDRLDDSFLKNAVNRHPSGLNFLAAPRDISEMKDIRPENIEHIIKRIATFQRQVIIDCASNSLNEESIRTMGNSEKIFIVLDLSVPAIRNAVRLAKELRRTGICEKRMEFVINRYTKNSAISVKEADSSLGKPVFWIFPNCYEDVFSSITSGTPLVYSHPRSPFGKSIHNFIKKIKDPIAQKEYRGINGIFGRPI